MGFPGGLGGKRILLQCRRTRFDPWEDTLEKGMATHSSILVWRIPWTEKPGGLQSMGLQRVRHDRQLRTITEYYRIPMEHFDCHIWGLFIFWLCQEAWGTLVPRLGIEPVAPALKVWSLSHWTTREIPRESFSFILLKLSILRNNLLKNTPLKYTYFKGTVWVLASIYAPSICRMFLKSFLLPLSSRHRVYNNSNSWPPLKTWEISRVCSLVRRRVTHGSTRPALLRRLSCLGPRGSCLLRMGQALQLATAPTGGDVTA